MAKADGEEAAVPTLMTVEAAAKAVGRLKGKLGGSQKSFDRPSSGRSSTGEMKDIMVEAGSKANNSIHPEEMLLRVIGEARYMRYMCCKRYMRCAARRCCCASSEWRVACVA